MPGKLLAGVLAGFVSAVFALLFVGLLIRQAPSLQDLFGPIALALVWLALLALALTAPTAGKAWRYLLLLAGLLAFVLPFIAFVEAGMHMDSDLAPRLGEVVVSVLGSELLTAQLGSGPAAFAGAWIRAADSELLGLALLVLGTVLLCLGLMVGHAPRDPVYREVRGALPGFANVIMAKGGACRFRVLSYRAMSDDEVMTQVWAALEDGRLREPLPGETATLVTRIGHPDEPPER